MSELDPLYWDGAKAQYIIGPIDEEQFEAVAGTPAEIAIMAYVRVDSSGRRLAIFEQKVLDLREAKEAYAWLGRFINSAPSGAS